MAQNAAAAAAATAAYKQLKEDFVSNLTGGTAAEVHLVTAIAPVCIVSCPNLGTVSSLYASNENCCYG